MAAQFPIQVRQQRAARNDERDGPRDRQARLRQATSPPYAPRAAGARRRQQCWSQWKHADRFVAAAAAPGRGGRASSAAGMIVPRPCIGKSGGVICAVAPASMRPQAHTLSAQAQLASRHRARGLR
eukprot:364570-Chlamydomonas_euryale.AAC.6